MKHFALTASALALTATAATAGGVDRSGQSIAAIFEQGTYAEISFGHVAPSVSGVNGPFATGDMSEDYSQLGFAFKHDFNDKLSVALIYDQPFGADVNYKTGTGYFLAPSTATLETHALTALLRYKTSDRFSIHGGVVYETLKTNAALTVFSPPATFIPYTGNTPSDGAWGYVVGMAYEIPDIAMRVALTYRSEIKHEMTSTETIFGGAPVNSAASITSPKSVNLDFQTGIAADTLLFGGIRWVDWSSYVIAPRVYTGAFGAPLLSYTNDVYTYSLGVGRKFSDTVSGSVSVSYEDGKPGAVGNLGPTNGKFGLTVGGKFALSDNVDLSAGVNYTWLGDAHTTTYNTQFRDNDAVGFGMKLGIRF